MQIHLRFQIPEAGAGEDVAFHLREILSQRFLEQGGFFQEVPVNGRPHGLASR